MIPNIGLVECWMGLCWTVYCHIHTSSGRRYIGLTKLTMMRRWNQHLANAKTKSGKGCAHFWNAIRKYGPNAFSHEELAQCRTLEDGNATEEEIILQYDTRNPERGFNIARGGDHIPHLIRKNPWDDPDFRFRMTAIFRQRWADPQSRLKLITSIKAAIARPETQVKRSNASKEVQNRLEVREKISAANRGIYRNSPGHAPFRGKHHTDATREKIRNINTGKSGRVHSAETRLKISIALKKRISM